MTNLVLPKKQFHYVLLALIWGIGITLVLAALLVDPHPLRVFELTAEREKGNALGYLGIVAILIGCLTPVGRALLGAALAKVRSLAGTKE